MVSIERDSKARLRFDPIVIDAFKEMFSGHVIQPGDSAYDDARTIWNGMIDKRPALIAQCIGVADVIQTVRFAREQSLPISIRGGGHNVAGHAVSEGGVMLDLSEMRSVYVDPRQRTARVEGGATWRNLDRETAAFGLATTGGVISSTGVAGLTLGGGIGWLVGKYGMAIDNLLSVDVVTAEGKFLRANEDENADLFWALRGGGGNFGVATSFEFRLHPVDEVLAGMLVWPADQARGLIEHYRDFTRDSPEEMTFYLETGTDAESGTRIVAVGGIYPGDIAEGERLVDGLRAFAPPIADMIGPMPYRNFQMAFDEEFPHGRRYYWKGLLLREIHDAVIDAVVEAEAKVPLPGCIIAIEHYRGAMNRVPVDATAFPHRDAQYQLVIVGGCDDTADDDRVREWVRGLYAAAQPYGLNAPFLNFNSIDDHERNPRVRAGYGSNWERLAEIKRRYDPNNFFAENNNILPQ